MSKKTLKIIIVSFILIISLNFETAAFSLKTEPIDEQQRNEFIETREVQIYTGEKTLKRVIRSFERESTELVHVYVNGEEIITTPEHPFYVPNKGWTDSIKLRAGDILVLQNGSYVIVEKIQHEILEQPIAVYNFEVEDFHTYYVGESSVLVHNANCNPMGKLKGNAPRSNQAQNKQFNDVANKYGLNKKQREMLHRSISDQGYSYSEIEDELLYLFPEKGGK